MAVNRSVQSPLLVGRDDLVALAERRIQEAKAGRGGLLLLAGEAGIGKSRLLYATIRQALVAHFRYSKGDLSPQDQLVPLASVSDLARTMDHATFGDLGPRLLAMRGGKGVDTLASRRILVREIAEAIVDAVDGPTLLAFEDLQWADELSLEVVGDLARLGRERPLLLIGAYRLDELPVGSIHREWRSRLLTQRFAEELKLERLGRGDTALMMSLILGTGLPASRELADAVFARTNGIPLHIEELLAALDGSVDSDGRAVRDASVPDTIEDVVVARVQRLSDGARAAARAGAVIGRCFAPEVLAGIMDRPVADLDAPLQELIESGILFPFEFIDRGYYDFRHQLLRDALYGTVPPAELRHLHARAGEFGKQLVGSSEIHASFHFERAGLQTQAFRAAVAGARAAAAVSSRFESFELFKRAIANLPLDLSAAEKGDVYAGYLDAAAAVDSIPAIEEAARAARAYYQEAGDALGAVRALQMLFLVARRDVRPRRERIAILEQVEAEVQAIPQSSERALVLAEQRFNQFILELEGGRFETAEALLEESRAYVLAGGESDVDLDGLIEIPRVLAGRAPDGLDTMLDVARRARDARLESAGVGAFRTAAATAVRVMDYPSAVVGIQEGLKYADEIQQSFCRSIMAAASAHVSWANGQWDDAIQTAELELVEPGSRRGILHARNALAYVAVGRGLVDRARTLLDESLAVARPSQEAELILPALWGLAEAALVIGDPARALQHCDEALEVALQTREAPLLVPFVVTGVRSALADRQPEAAQRWLDQVTPALRGWSDLAGPAIAHAEGLISLAGGSLVAARTSLDAAVTGWDARGRVWEATWARIDLATCLLRSNRYVEASRLIAEIAETATRLGSKPLQARAGELHRLARGRGSEAEAWYPLTVREFEVARQIAAGLTNAQIAAALFVAPKTVSSHVEHILAKLGASRRAEIAAWAATIAGPAAEPVAARA
jgi:DNA-binding CsgD family transcriptional regulator